MQITRNDILFSLSLLFALWFAAMGMVWAYWAALVVAYPVGLASLLLWRVIRQDGKNRNRLIPVILCFGLVVSLSALVYLLIWD